MHFLATVNTPSVLIANAAFSLTSCTKVGIPSKKLSEINSSDYCLGMHLVLKLV